MAAAEALGVGVGIGRMIETPSAGVGVKIDGSMRGDSEAGATISGARFAAAADAEAADFWASDSARSLAMTSTRLADTGTCVRAEDGGNSVSRAGE